MPSVLFTLPAFQKMQAYIKAVDGEVSGLGSVEVLNNTFIVSDIFLLPQFCTKAQTTMTEEGISDFIYTRFKNGQTMTNIKLWWHSHFLSPVYWSETDNRTIRDSFPKASWILSVVGNQYGDVLARVDIYKPLALTFDKLPVSVSLPVNQDLLDKVREEVEQKVVLKKPLYELKEILNELC